MTHRLRLRGEGSDAARSGATSRVRRNFPGTGIPGWLLLGLVALGLPRTVLADLGIVAPESSWIYYVLALTPFAVWLAVAIFRRTGSPMRDHLLAGGLYGFSLVIVHEALWAVDSSLGQHLPQSATSLAGQFGSPLRELIPHGYGFVIAMTIGLGVGLIAGIVAAAAKRVRAIRVRRFAHPRADGV